MRSILALYTANAKEFARDRMAGFFTLLMPILFAMFFGLIFGGGDAQKLSVGLINEDASIAGQQIVAGLTSPESQQMLNVKVGSRDEVLAALDKGDLSIAIVLPTNLGQAIAAGEPVNVPVYYDEARQTSAGIGLGVARNLVADLNMKLKGVEPSLVMQATSVQTTPMKATDFYIPSLLAMAMLWLGLFGTTLPLVEQREQGVLRRLSASPVRRINLLAGQVAWRLTVGLLQAAIFVLVGVFVLGVHIQGNWFLFIAMAVLGALMFISFGYLMAGVSRTTDSAVALAQVANFPMMFLSGLFFEPSVLPGYLRSVMHVMPPTYLGDAFRQIMVGYNALYPLWLDFAVVGGFLVLFVALGLRFFRWETA